jgi:hypothetical protein
MHVEAKAQSDAGGRGRLGILRIRDAIFAAKYYTATNMINR